MDLLGKQSLNPWIELQEMAAIGGRSLLDIWQSRIWKIYIDAVHLERTLYATTSSSLE